MKFGWLWICACRRAGGGSDVFKVLPSSYDKLYTRWYVKWDAGIVLDKVVASRERIGRLSNKTME